MNLSSFYTREVKGRSLKFELYSHNKKNLKKKEEERNRERKGEKRERERGRKGEEGSMEGEEQKRMNMNLILWITL